MAYSKFDRATGPRKALLRGQVMALLARETIVTTEAKAKAAGRIAERLITLAKEDSVHHRRHALTVVPSEDVVRKLFADLGPRYKDVAGGYTRAVKLGARRGDGAPLVQLSLK